MVIQELLRLFDEKNKAVDFDDFASSWIDFLQPFLDDKRQRNIRNRHSFNLNDLNTPYEIKRIDFNIKDLQEILDHTPIYQDIDNKIAACIVGVTQK